MIPLFYNMKICKKWWVWQSNAEFLWTLKWSKSVGECNIQGDSFASSKNGTLCLDREGDRIFCTIKEKIIMDVFNSKRVKCRFIAKCFVPSSSSKWSRAGRDFTKTVADVLHTSELYWNDVCMSKSMDFFFYSSEHAATVSVAATLLLTDY